MQDRPEPEHCNLTFNDYHLLLTLFTVRFDFEATEITRSKLMTDNRPLSPHMSVYRPQLTSVLSIVHRGTGIVLSLSVLLLVLWIAALSSGPASFARAQTLTGNTFVQLIMLGGMFSFFYHLCNGVRHLFWDMGKGLTIESTYRSGWAVVIASLVLSASVFAYAMLGGVA